jgi:hypothetical protein
VVTPGAPQTDDWALVVGISHYPKPDFAAQLQGPDNDAIAVRDWLVDERGGRLPPDNVVLLRTANFAPVTVENPQPASGRIQEELEKLADRTLQRPGRRLYLYFSGHGFAPVLEEAAVFTAEASRLRPTHVYVHDYLRWFRKAQLFQQSVLWVDACMNFMQSVPVEQIPLRDKVGTAVPGPAFIALAAQTKRALELEMPDGNVHGVFTWTLLEGLRGRAANRRARVTGKSLESFLHNAMADLLPTAARTSAAVDLQPFIRADEGMEFNRLEQRPQLNVTLRMPTTRAGQTLQIWSGSPHQTAVTATLEGPEWTGGLVRGLYVAEVRDAELRHGFQVTGAGPVEAVIDRTGPAVVPAAGSELFELTVSAPNPATTVVVIDDDFQWVTSGTGGLREREAPGVYKIRAQIGRDLTTSSEEVVLLDGDLRLDGGLVPVLESPAPLPGAAPVNQHHSDLFQNAAARTGPAGGDAVGTDSELCVMVRYWAPAAAPAELPHPMTGLRLVDESGATVAQLADGSRLEDEQDDPISVWQQPIEPGTHFLRQELDRATYEAAFTVSPGWLTQVVLRRTAGLGSAWQDDHPSPGDVLEPDDLALFMRRPDASTGAHGDDVLEAARLALVHGRDVFSDGQGEELRTILLEEHPDPIATVIGCHLLLRTMAGGRWSDAALGPAFDAAVVRLRELVGGDHPDVEALSLRCTDRELRATAPFLVPPSFTASWQLIVEASYDRSELLPERVWERLKASTRLGPFLVWGVDDTIRSAHVAQLHAWLEAFLPKEQPDLAKNADQEARPPQPAAVGRRAAHRAAVRRVNAGLMVAQRDPLWVPPKVREAARRMGIPATGAAELWRAHRTGGW